MKAALTPLAILLALAPAAAGAAGPEACERRSLLLFIGDGMGLAHINAARLAAGGAGGRLAMERLPVVGLVRTHAHGALVTDSAAAATAMATGAKTRNGRIGVDAQGRRLASLMELAQAAGLATGVIATSSVTHATPAAFAAHIDDRDREAEIARQLVASELDVVLGGGRALFRPRGRRDDRDLLAAARRAGFEVLGSRGELEQAAGGGGRLLGLFADEALSGAAGEPVLAAMTGAALAHVGSRRAGFVLMVEGSQIDWGGHANDAAMVVEELLAFDAAVAVGAAFARRRGCTLMLVTADHETGGLAVMGGDPAGGRPFMRFSTPRHSAVDVPLYALGPGAERFAGTLENTDIARRASALLGLARLPRFLDRAPDRP